MGYPLGYPIQIIQLRLKKPVSLGRGFLYRHSKFFYLSLPLLMATTSPDRASKANKLGNTMMPLNRSDRFHTRSTFKVEPMMTNITTNKA